MFIPSPIDPVTADSIEREIDQAIDAAENSVFPTPWHYEIELHSDDAADSSVTITDRSGYEFASYSGDCDGAHAFIESARAMEESHVLLQRAKSLVANWENGNLSPYIQSLAAVIADAERA